MKRWLLVLLTFTSGSAEPGLKLNLVQPGPRNLASGSLSLQANPEIQTISFAPPLSYRIHNEGFPAWSITLYAPVPSLGGTQLPVWRYQTGSGQLTALNPQLTPIPQNDSLLSGDLSGGGLTVLSTQGQGDFVYTIGNFQLAQPAAGPAGTYSTSLTVTLSGQP
ncbi:MAG: hypothetical protein U0931_20065 [Vulcanimicrobiota bacterium]